ncbi:MAG: chorismate mutase [Methanomicrobiales archaeon]|nr:chorismate mutase [Methanomicrobiales archaeon]
MTIGTIREEINQIDRQLIALIGKRQGLAAKLALLKHREGLPIRDEKRRREVLEDVFNFAVEQQIDPVFVQKIFELLIDMSEQRQRGCSGEGNLP